MAVPIVTLTGSGATGRGRPLNKLPPDAAQPPHSLRVKLGRRPAHSGKSCVRLVDHWEPLLPWTPPAVWDWSERAARSLAEVLGNDQFGDCVIAGKMHGVGVWSANDTDSGGEVVATTGDAVREYRRICGPGDNGCVITEVLDVMMAGGLKIGGRAHRITGYVAVDSSRRELVQSAVYLFGGVALGINLPSAWLSSDVWDVTHSRSVGGHDVQAIGYGAEGVEVSSWGRKYLITWRAMSQPGRVDECWAMLAADWLNNDNLAPSHVNVATLEAALASLAVGKVPTPDILPEVNPLTPNVTNDVAVFETGNRRLASRLAALMEPLDLETENTVTGRLTIRRGKLTPEQWQKLIKLIADVAAAILAILGGTGAVGS